MEEKLCEEIINILKSGKSIPESYQALLFPINHKEYSLEYKDKKSKESILSISSEPQAVPFQIEKEFNCNDESDWRNLLIYGDNFQALKTIYENKDDLIKDKVKGKVNLIYIDPPFATENEFNSKSGEKAYSDKVKGAEFIEFLRERLILAYEILSETGSIFVHLDWKMSHYIKVILDEIFGKNNFKNEIIWTYTGPGSPGMRQFNRKHDTILWYSKSQQWIFNSDDIRMESHVHVGGFNNEMNKEESKKYIELGKIPEDWWNIAVAARKKVDGIERTGYPTEKPQKLLERIIKATTNPGDLVMDFFAGSGTTGYVAEKLNRRWIMCDIGKLSIYSILKRFLMKKNNPFYLINAGCYNLSTVFNLEKQKYYDFVMDLFHVDKKKATINGVNLDGKRRGDWVKVFTFQDFTDTTAIDANYIYELHTQIGSRIGNNFYLIAPEMNVDIIGDYYRIDNVKYYLLRIPYQVISELHKLKFKKLQQPNNKEKINYMENSVGFYFNEMPEVKSSLIIDDNTIQIIIESVTSPYIKLDDDNKIVSNILAMVLIDSTNNPNFIMQDVFFADDIMSDDGYKIEINKKNCKSDKIKIIYIDIYGNEFKEVLEIK